MSAAPMGSRTAPTLTLLVLAMETSWMAMLALFWDAGLTGAGARGPALVVALYPFALVASPVIARLTRRRWQLVLSHGLAFGGLAALLAMIAFSGAFGLDSAPAPATASRLSVFALLGAMVWARGAAVARRPSTPLTVALGFQFGLVAVLAVLGLGAGLDIMVPGATILPPIFLLSGLLALWRARAAGRGIAAGRNLAPVLLGLGLVVGLGLVLAAVIDRGLLETGWSGIAAAGDRLGGGLARLAALLPQPTLLADAPPPPDPLATPNVDISDIDQQEPHWLVAPLVLTALAGVAAAAIFGALRVLLAWLRESRAMAPRLDEDATPVRLRDRLAALWLYLQNRWTRLARRIVHALRPARAAGTPGPALRRLYLRLERRLAARGWRRHPFETPLAFADRVRPFWPGHAGDLDLATRLYVRERYGPPVSASPARLARLEKKLRRSLKTLKSKDVHARTPGPSGAGPHAPGRDG